MILLSFSGANLTHVVVLKPKQSGISNSSHAIITYQKSEKNTDVQVRTTYCFASISYFYLLENLFIRNR